jgi:hypothetical protein
MDLTAVVAERGDLAHVVLFLWASAASALVLALVREIAAQARRLDAFVAEIARVTRRIDDPDA